MDLLAGQTIQKADGTTHQVEKVLADKGIVAIYFSAHWCPPCRAFTPVLKDFYEEVNDKGLELIFVSSDRSPEDMVKYMNESHGEWYAVAHGSDLGQSLKQRFGISGIPALIILKKDGTLITKDGRQLVQTKGPMAMQDWQ